MKYIKAKVILTILLIGIWGCKEKQDKTISNQNQPSAEKSKPTQTKKSDSGTTLLCKINGKDWSYSKASGIITKNKRTGEKLATVTFVKKMNKRTESIQLSYDGETLKLKNIAISLYIEQNKFAGTKGGLTFTDYSLFSSDKKAENEMLSGTINLTSETVLSGNATAVVVHNAKRLIKHESDKTITITDLKFDQVPYSDATKPLNF